MVRLADIQAEVPGFLEILGLLEEPLGMYYSPGGARRGLLAPDRGVAQRRHGSRG